MNATDVLEVVRESIIVTLKIGGPIMIISLVVGLVISLFQALTQIQEMTLTFVPKIIAIFVAIAISGSFIGEQMLAFTQNVYSHIEKGF